MSSGTALQENYDTNAKAYHQFLSTPLGKLERDLFDLSITNCGGLRVLDLGGGTGLRARDALKAGAKEVDVVDISVEMMRLGQEYEKSIGRDCITWHYGDVSQSLDHLGLGPYDMVIANGIFDHAHNTTELEAMWRNAARYLKPGGRLVANRNDPRSGSARDGKYGVRFTDFEKFDEGVRYRYRTTTEPPLNFGSIALNSYSVSDMHIPEKYFDNIEDVAWTDTPTVKSDLAFWQQYLDDPILYIFTARKRVEKG